MGDTLSIRWYSAYYLLICHEGIPVSLYAT
jgi:hypothetical protein